MKLGRRHFLRGTAGALVALPLLDSLQVRAQMAATPRRLVLMYTPNGTIQSAWWPKNVTGPTSFDLNTTLTPLEAHKSRLTILGGVDLSVTGVGPGGPHQRGIGALFTGRELQEGKFVDGCGANAGWANGVSIDQVVATAVGASVPIKSLELAARCTQADVQARISYAGPGNPLPPMNTPLEVFNRLFANLDVPVNLAAQVIAKRKSVLDTVQEQYGILKKQVSSNDATKLERHLDLVRDLEARLTVSASGGAVCAKPATPSEQDPEGEAEMPEIVRLHFEFLALAFACDLTRVGSVQISNALNRIRYPWLGSLGSGHTLSHSGDNDVAATQEVVTRHTWHAQMLAHFMDSLGAIAEGEGSALDNTLVVWCSEVSKGNLHTLVNMPFLVAGTLGGRVPGGRYMEYGAVPHSQLLLSILHAFDVPDTSFGHPDFAKGDLPGFLA